MIKLRRERQVLLQMWERSNSPRLVLFLRARPRQQCHCFLSFVSIVALSTRVCIWAHFGWEGRFTASEATHQISAAFGLMSWSAAFDARVWTWIGTSQYFSRFFILSYLIIRILSHLLAFGVIWVSVQAWMPWPSSILSTPTFAFHCRCALPRGSVKHRQRWRLIQSQSLISALLSPVQISCVMVNLSQALFWKFALQTGFAFLQLRCFTVTVISRLPWWPDRQACGTISCNLWERIAGKNYSSRATCSMTRPTNQFWQVCSSLLLIFRSSLFWKLTFDLALNQLVYNSWDLTSPFWRVCAVRLSEHFSLNAATMDRKVKTIELNNLHRHFTHTLGLKAIRPGGQKVLLYL